MEQQPFTKKELLARVTSGQMTLDEVAIILAKRKAAKATTLALPPVVQPEPTSLLVVAPPIQEPTSAPSILADATQPKPAELVHFKDLDFTDSPAHYATTPSIDGQTFPEKPTNINDAPTIIEVPFRDIVEWLDWQIREGSVVLNPKKLMEHFDVDEDAVQKIIEHLQMYSIINDSYVINPISLDIWKEIDQDQYPSGELPPQPGTSEKSEPSPEHGLRERMRAMSAKIFSGQNRATRTIIAGMILAGAGVLTVISAIKASEHQTLEQSTADIPAPTRRAAPATIIPPQQATQPTTIMEIPAQYEQLPHFRQLDEQVKLRAKRIIEAKDPQAFIMSYFTELQVENSTKIIKLADLSDSNRKAALGEIYRILKGSPVKDMLGSANGSDITLNEIPGLPKGEYNLSPNLNRLNSDLRYALSRSGLLTDPNQFPQGGLLEVVEKVRKQLITKITQ